MGVNGHPHAATPEEDDRGFGDFVYCGQHLRPHATGWCTVSNREKLGLGVGKNDENALARAVAKCRRFGLKLWGDVLAKQEAERQRAAAQAAKQAKAREAARLKAKERRRRARSKVKKAKAKQEVARAVPGRRRVLVLALPLR